MTITEEEKGIAHKVEIPSHGKQRKNGLCNNKGTEVWRLSSKLSQTTKDPYVSGSKTKIGKITIIWGEMPMGPMLAVLIHILGKH